VTREPLALCRKLEIQVLAAVFNPLSCADQRHLLRRRRQHLVCQSECYLLGIAKFRDVGLVRRDQVDGYALQRLDDVFVNNILPVDGDLLPAKRVQEGIAILRVLDSLEALGALFGGSGERGSGGGDKERGREVERLAARGGNGVGGA
jgi:hypothetical protein